VVLIKDRTIDDIQNCGNYNYEALILSDQINFIVDLEGARNSFIAEYFVCSFTSDNISIWIFEF
jgi:hypothetical protein